MLGRTLIFYSKEKSLVRNTKMEANDVCLSVFAHFQHMQRY